VFKGEEMNESSNEPAAVTPKRRVRTVTADSNENVTLPDWGKYFFISTLLHLNLYIDASLLFFISFYTIYSESLSTLLYVNLHFTNNSQLFKSSVSSEIPLKFLIVTMNKSVLLLLWINE
jgi:hypothetical protein